MARVTPITLLAISALLIRVAGSAEAGNTAGQDWRNLLGNSPFAGANTAAEPLPPGALEFRGVVREGDALWVNLYDPVSKHAQWSVVPGSGGTGLRLESYDPNTERLVIVQSGRRLDLALRQPHVVLPADIRPLVVPVISDAPAADGNVRQAFVRQLPTEAREMLEQAQRRRHPLVPDRSGATSEFTTR